MKFDWNTATSIRLPIFYGCPLVTKVGLGKFKTMSQPKIFVLWTFTKNTGQPLIRVNCDKTMWIVEEKLFWFILMLAINGKEDFIQDLQYGV